VDPKSFAPASAVEQSATAALYDHYVVGNYGRPAISLVRGAGTNVWDDEGREYLDFTSGIAVTALGHCHPVWVKAMRDQLGQVVHVSNLFRTPNQGELARRLVVQAGPGRVFFCNSGAEANEGLLKLARLHGRALSAGEEGKRYKVICAKNAFHGRTFGGMSATPQEKIQGGFRPLVPGFAFGELNNLESFRELVDEQTAAIFVETVQGEGGVHSCTTEFLVGLRKLCDERGLLLMLDEVQCGIGRSGRFFAFQEHGVVPDAIGMAKGLGGGFPIGAIWIREPYAGLFTAGSHGTTFGGTPLGCAAALAVLEIMDSERILEHVASASKHLKKGLEALKADIPKAVLEVRGVGLMVGIQLPSDPAPVVAKLRESGLLCPSAGGNVIRLLPPLNVAIEEIDRALEILRAVLGKL
jgi:acetylornithine aminotransferase/acetylornithine/N-succinyldiaminopimelate aminotransferase